jgi:hypothetical protein
MGFCLYDANGYVGDIASNNGLVMMSDYVLFSTDSKPVKELFEDGCTPVTKELIADFKAILCPDKGIMDSIPNLADLLGKCDTIAIISDGMTADSENTPEGEA